MHYKTQAELKEREFKEFAKKWKLIPENIEYIWFILEKFNFKYGKVSRILSNQHIQITPRQLKYFKGKITLIIQLRGQHPANYSELLRNKG